MAVSPPQNPTSVTATEPARNYSGPLAMVTTLFFIWGSLTSLNDVLIPFAQHVFNLQLAASMLIQTAFFSAYFIFSIPAAKIIDWIGYQKAIVVGLATMIVACLVFYPAARIPSFPIFLVALIVLATGITILQVAANPYVTILGRSQTASSRLNLTQAFNSLGTAIFPWIGAHLILRATTASITQNAPAEAEAVVRLYVYFFSVVLILLAIAIATFRFPKIEAAAHDIGQAVDDSIWKHPNLVFGAVAIFVYVGAEVSIGSSISNYLALDNIGHFIDSSAIPDAFTRYRAALGLAARYISLYWLGAMIGRFLGSAILQKVKAQKLLALCATVATLLVITSVLSNGHVAMWSILAVGLFNSIMFPTIFTLGVAELGPLTGDASGLLNMAIVGGAIIPLLVGKIGDHINRVSYPAMSEGQTSWGQGIHHALIIPSVCYLYILFFAVSGARPNSERGPRA
jgi:FHS family L-fucose permease-like MFS transporter